jgi:hypothetical protein
MYEKGTVRLRLTGKDGNAFNILGMAQAALRKAGATPEQKKEYLDEATAGDYNDLLRVTMEWFDVS